MGACMKGLTSAQLSLTSQLVKLTFVCKVTNFSVRRKDPVQLYWKGGRRPLMRFCWGSTGKTKISLLGSILISLDPIFRLISRKVTPGITALFFCGGLICRGDCDLDVELGIYQKGAAAFF